MKTAVRNLVSCELRESYAPVGLVDRANGIIRHVKILGKESPNRHELDVEGTIYLDEALESLLPLCRDVNVNVGHRPRDPKTGQPLKVDRDPIERFAWLENPVRESDGTYGDLHFLDANDPFAVRVMNAAEKHPSSFALSIDAIGQGDVKNGKYLVHRIESLKSVDLVADGGTNRSLFEGQEQPRRKKVMKNQLFEALKKGIAKRREKHPKSTRGQWLLEMGEAVDGQEVPIKEEDATEPAPADELDHLFQAFKQIREKDPEKANKILAMLKAEIAEEEGDEEEVEEDEEPEAKNKDEEEKKTEKMESRLRELEAKDNCRELCESLSFQADKETLQLLMDLPTPEKRTALIKKLKGAKPTNRPRSSSGIPAPVLESEENRTVKIPETADELACWLNN
jgi:hypothetical protein